MLAADDTKCCLPQVVLDYQLPNWSHLCLYQVVMIMIVVNVVMVMSILIMEIMIMSFIK